MDMKSYLGYFLAMFAVVMAVVFLRLLMQCWQSLSWPSASAVILTSKVTLLDRRRDTWDVAVTYAYCIAGCDYIGSRIYFRGTNVVDRPRAVRLATKYAPDAVVQVLYQPGKPAESVLEPGFTWSLFMPLFVNIMLALAAWLMLR